MKFGVLGRVQVEHDGRLIEVGRRRERCLLGVLLLEAGAAVPAERLIDLLWDSQPPDTARAALRTHVSRLRALLDPGGDGSRGVELRHGKGGYLVRVEAGAVDAHRFRDMVEQARLVAEPATRAGLLREALDLWRGPLLADAASDRLRSRLGPWWAEARLKAREDAIEAELACGRHRELIGELGALCQEQPHRERFIGLLMLALYRAGRQAEALEVFARADRRLRGELGIDPGPELREVHRRVLAADPGLEVDPASAAAPGEIPMRAAVPRRLPVGTRVFTSREHEIARLVELAAAADSAQSSGTAVISAIDGMAGVGKTALAVHVAHLLAERFGDGQLFIDLYGHTQGYPPRTANDALGVLLQSLDVPPRQIPDSRDERAALYRQRLAGTRTLILLDNAADEAQVRPLIPAAPGCMVLITGRRKLKALDEAHPLALSVLPRSDALALFGAVAGRGTADEPAAVEIVDLCGCLPLAVRIAAALLRHRPAWSVEHLAGLLRGRRRRLAALTDGERDLTALFDISLQHLPDPGRQLFACLGLIPGPDLDAYAAAALADIDPAAATSLLQNLVDHNLLNESAPGRYRMHDLVRAHARTIVEHRPVGYREAALDRLLDYYQHTAGLADALTALFYDRPTSADAAPAHVPDLPDSGAAWAWLRTERPNLLAALHHTTTNAQDARTVALTAGLSSLLRTDGPWTLALTLHATAAAAAHRLNDLSAHGHALIESGHLRRSTGDYPGSTRDLRQALGLYRELGDRGGQAQALVRLAPVRMLTGDYPAAARDLHEALELYRGLGNRLGQATTLNFLGQVRLMSGDYPGAARDYQAALEQFQALGQRLGQAHALINLGYARILIGDYPAAARDQREALELYRGLADRMGQANALTFLGEVHRLTGDHSGAARDLREAMRLYRDLGNQIGLANALGRMGQTRAASGDLAGAIRDLRQSLDTVRRLGSRVNEAWILNAHAAVCAADGDPAQAETLHREALRLAVDMDLPDEQAAALYGLGECRLHEGKIHDGTDYLRQALEIYRRLGMPAADRVAARLADFDPGRAGSTAIP